MAATIKDVAREAGVSISTVSKVMNNWPTISEETARRVREVMKRLEYSPNQRAASFARGSTRAVAFLTSLQRHEAFHNPHMFEILCGAQEVLTRKGYTVMLVDVTGEEQPGATARELLQKQAVDGMIVHGSAINSQTAALMIRREFPHIVIGKPGFESQVCWIDTNNRLSGQIAARHLADGGAKRIAFIGGRRVDQISLFRQQGYLDALHEKGLEAPPEFIRYTDSSLEESEREAMALLQGSPVPDGLVCENNIIALGALRAVRRLGLEMPRQLALITFDEYPFSAIMDPVPTVVDIDVYDMGQQAASMLLRKLKNPALQVQSYTTLPQLIQRGTTKPVV